MEAGKWAAAVRDADFAVMLVSSYFRMALGTTDRNCRLRLTRIDELSASIEELSARIEAEMCPFARQLERLATIPGVGQRTAEVIIAETGADMTRFRTPARDTSLHGPGSVRATMSPPADRPRVNAGHGYRWLGGAQGTAAMAAGHTRERTYLGARCARLVPRLGKQKTIVAIEHSILTAVWHMLTDDVDYHYTLGAGRTSTSPTRLLIPATLIGTVGAAVLTTFTDSPTPAPGGVLAAAYLGLGPMAAGYALWTHAMTRGGAERLSPLGYATPLLSTVVLLANGPHRRTDSRWAPLRRPAAWW